MMTVSLATQRKNSTITPYTALVDKTNEHYTMLSGERGNQQHYAIAELLRNIKQQDPVPVMGENRKIARLV